MNTQLISLNHFLDKKHIFWFVLLLTVAMPNHAALYKWKDASGKVHYSNTKPKDITAEKLTFGPSPSSTQSASKKNPKDRGIHALKHGEVIMYSTEWCGFCARARTYFKKNGIRYKEYDIEKSDKAQREHAALGGGGVPLLLIGTKNSTKKVRGFNEKYFKAVYNQ